MAKAKNFYKDSIEAALQEAMSQRLRDKVNTLLDKVLTGERDAMIEHTIMDYLEQVGLAPLSKDKAQSAPLPEEPESESETIPAAAEKPPVKPDLDLGAL